METLRVAVCDDDRVYLEQIKEEIKEYIGSMAGNRRHAGKPFYRWTQVI